MSDPLKNSKPNIVIIGASGHAKVIIDIIEKRNEYNIIGLIDSFKPVGTSIFEYKILGHEEDMPALSKIYNFNSGIIAIGDNWTRKIIHKKIKKIFPLFEYVNAIHPQSIIGKNVKIGKGTVIMAGAIVNSEAIIGKFCILNTKVSLGHDSNLKKYSSLAPNSTIGGNVKIGTCSAICLGANVIQGINIGKHAIIGAGSLIVRNVDSYSMVYGVPAKTIKSINKGEKYLYQAKKEKDYTAPLLEVITEEDKWSEFLNEIEIFDFYHTFSYHFASKSKNETPILLKYKNKDVLIGLPLLLRDIPGTDYKDATSAYGYVGPISKGVDQSFDNSIFNNEMEKYFKENSIISVFSRLNPYISNQCKILINFGDIISQGRVVNIDLNLSIDSQRTNYRSRLKTHVNKSRRLCSIRKVITENDLQDFIDLYHENMDRVNAKESYYFSNLYFQNLLKSTDFETIILLAVDNESGKIIAGSMFIITNGIVQYHLSGTKNNFLHLTPTKLLIDEMRIIASKNGYRYFNLGGGLGGRDDDSLFDFKSSFSKDFKDFNLWKLITNQKIYDELVHKRGINIESNYFPLYRSVDDINVAL